MGNVIKFLEKYVNLEMPSLMLGLRSAIWVLILSIFKVAIFQKNLGLIVAVLGVFAISLIEANAVTSSAKRRLKYSFGMSLGCAISCAIGAISPHLISLQIVALIFFVALVGFSDTYDQLWSTSMVYVSSLYFVGSGLVATNYLGALMVGLYFLLGGFGLAVLGAVELFFFGKKYDLTKAEVEQLPLFGINEVYFALFLLFAVACGDLVAKLFQLDHGFWIPMTILLVMKARHDNSMLRIKHRLFGTLIGGVFAILISIYISNIWLLVVLMSILYFLTAITITRHYGTYVFFLTMMVAILYKFILADGQSIALHRMVNTIIAVILVLLLIVTMRSEFFKNS